MNDQEIQQLANEFSEQILPSNSSDLYEKRFDHFLQFVQNNEINETIIKAYFTFINRYQPSTLLSIYSILKKLLLLRKNLDITKYPSILDVLKNKLRNHKKKQALTFSTDQIDKFLCEAPDDRYLVKKLVFLLGVFGGMRRSELCALTFEDIQLLDGDLKVIIRASKTDPAQIGFYFLAPSRDQSWKCPVFYYKKYLTQVTQPTGRFFRNFNATSKKISSQPMGKNNISAVPLDIAKYLNLQNPKQYTGHTIRRTAATWLADQGVSLLDLKRFGRWKSDTVAEGYIAESVSNKRKLADAVISNQVKQQKQQQQEVPTQAPTIPLSSSSSQISFSNCTIQSIVINNK